MPDLYSKSRSAKTELMITGRHAHPHTLEAADLITVVQEVKHYSQKVVEARHGIEK
ncbi:MAG: cob(I)yrinic acid a,c-diamide adenosyltransferase [Desulfobacterales bacterium]|nr:cob(I)yrinic acid a,c-diamide adenosyltransferase [Desulfobacterales bacterium]